MQGSTQHILIVDDSEDDALLLTAELRSILPDSVFWRVEDEEQMCAALVEREWDLIISDHTMPRFDSRRALQLAQRFDKDVPVIIVSGTMSDQLGIGAMAVGARDYVDKSNRARLLPVVERELRNASLLRAKEAAERGLLQLRNYDPLTRLPNRQLFTTLVDSTLERLRRGARSAALVFVDLDRFMRVNESFGYAMGDELLKAVGLRLQHCLDNQCVIARVGQDKFAIFAQNVAGEEQARTLAERIRAEFETPFSLEGVQLFITCSVGIGLYPRDGQDANALIRNAESAKVLARRQGPGNVAFHLADERPRLGDPVRIENALRHALDSNELFLLYQPCLELSTGRITGCEALLRWRHPELGVIEPEAFIPIADDSGLIIEIGRWALSAATRQAMLWQDAGLPALSIAVNVSAAQFRKPGFADDVAQALGNTGLDPQRLELEITETVVMQDAETTIGTLASLKKMGVRISIDDFGTGYSSLSYLRRFSIDSLKIDKSFVRDLPVDGDSQAIVDTIIGLAKSLKLDVIAEGVEKVEQASYLGSRRCDRLQGYLVARPLQADDFAALASSPAPFADRILTQGAAKSG
jgi:diguanylate cyclase (GGDEF)-like protein